MLCQRGICYGAALVCLSVRPSQIGCFIKTAKHNHANSALGKLRETSFLIPKILLKLRVAVIPKPRKCNFACFYRQHCAQCKPAGI